MASIRCLLRSLTPPMHLLIIFPTLAILGGRTFNLTQRPSGWRASLLYFMSAVSKCSKMWGLNYAEQHALLFPNVTEQFWWDFLEKTANLVYIEFQHFSGKMLFSIHTKLPMTNLLKGAASSARAVHFWHDVYWFARRGNLYWTDNTSWVPRHSEDTGHAASFFGGRCLSFTRYLSKQCEVPPLRSADSCILCGIFCLRPRVNSAGHRRKTLALEQTSILFS